MYFFVNRQASARQDELRDAIRLQQANVGAEQNAYVMNFPTQADKDKAVTGLTGHAGRGAAPVGAGAQ